MSQEIQGSDATPTTPKGFLKRLAAMMATKFGTTLLCSLIATAVFKSPAIIHGFRVFISFISVLGDEKASKTIGKILGGDDKESAEGEAPKPKLKDKLKQKAQVALEPVKEKIDDSVVQGKQAVNKAERKVEDKANEAIGAIKQQPQLPIAQPVPPQNGALAYNNAPPMPPNMALPPNMNSRAGNAYAQQAIARKAAADEREARLAPIRELYNIWWAEHGPNGKCPRCKQPMTVSRAGKGATRCPNQRCGFQWRADQVRSMGAPPMPQEPPPQFYAWKKGRDDAETRKGAAANKEQGKAP